MSKTQAAGTTPTLTRKITGLPALEDRRRIAVLRVRDGPAQAEVARFLGISTRSVAYWMEWYRNQSEDGFKLRPIPGLILEKVGVQFNANYFCHWLKVRNCTPQMPKTWRPNATSRRSPSML